MKITPMPASAAGNPSTNIGNVQVGPSASPDRVARAKAIAAGQVNVMPSDNYVDPATEKAELNVKRITMKTNATVDRYGTPQTQEGLSEAPALSELPISDTDKAVPIVEETAPLSPQFAALARQRRALQVKEREIADRERALASQPASAGAEDIIARLKAAPLSVLQEHGVTYDQLTQDILAGQNGNPEIQQLKAEIKALKEGVDKTLSERDAAQEKQVLSEIRREAEALAASGEDYELVRATQSYPVVVDLINRTFKQTGEILDTPEAMRLVEEDLINETLKIANTGKIRSKISTPTPQQQSPQQKQFRTLTNRDSATPAMSRRDRALAAALGTLKR